MRIHSIPLNQATYDRDQLKLIQVLKMNRFRRSLGFRVAGPPSKSARASPITTQVVMQVWDWSIINSRREEFLEEEAAVIIMLNRD